MGVYEVSVPVSEPEKPITQTGACLPLDKENKRVFGFNGPLVVTEKELGRIQCWLEFQLIIEPETETEGGN